MYFTSTAWCGGLALDGETWLATSFTSGLPLTGGSSRRCFTSTTRGSLGALEIIGDLVRVSASVPDVREKSLFSSPRTASRARSCSRPQAGIHDLGETRLSHNWESSSIASSLLFLVLPVCSCAVRRVGDAQKIRRAEDKDKKVDSLFHSSDQSGLSVSSRRTAR